MGHVPCCNLATLRDDPSARDFWGESINKFAAAFHAADGVVGGAIWGSVDDIFELGTGLVGCGEWGIIDIWRRRKPEQWLTKKADSPIRVADSPVIGPKQGDAIPVQVENRYDFTNPGELTVEWRLNGRTGHVRLADVAPQSRGTLTVPEQAWKRGTHSPSGS